MESLHSPHLHRLISQAYELALLGGRIGHDGLAQDLVSYHKPMSWLCWMKTVRIDGKDYEVGLISQAYELALLVRNLIDGKTVYQMSHITSL